VVPSNPSAGKPNRPSEPRTETAAERTARLAAKAAWQRKRYAEARSQKLAARAALAAVAATPSGNGNANGNGGEHADGATDAAAAARAAQIKAANMEKLRLAAARRL
jgi:hypothetical protein